MAPHSSNLAWKIPWMEEPGRLQSMGSLRVRHDWATSLSLFTFMHWRRKWQPTPVFLLGESQEWGSLVGCRLWGRTESDTTERLHFNFSLACIGEGNGHPPPVFLPGQSQGWGSLVGCRLWGRTESDTTEATLQQQQQGCTNKLYYKEPWNSYSPCDYSLTTEYTFRSYLLFSLIRILLNCEHLIHIIWF